MSFSAVKSSEKSFLCEPCKVQCSDEATYQAHLLSFEHKIKEIRTDVDRDQKLVSKKGSGYWCDLCKVRINLSYKFKLRMFGNLHCFRYHAMLQM